MGELGGTAARGVPSTFFIYIYILYNMSRVFKESVLVAEPDRLNGEFRLIGIHIMHKGPSK